MRYEEPDNPSTFMGEAHIADPTYTFILGLLPTNARTLLDLGSGRGRFLMKAREAGYVVQGVDSDPWSVEQTQAAGVTAACEDIWAFLERQHAESFDVVTAIHLIEHLDTQPAQQLINRVSFILRPGGSFVLVTPNFADWRVASETFWLDPTHVRPYPLALLAQMGERASLSAEHASTQVLVRMGFRRMIWRPLQRIRFGAEYDRMNAVMLLRRAGP